MRAGVGGKCEPGGAGGVQLPVWATLGVWGFHLPASPLPTQHHRTATLPFAAYHNNVLQACKSYVHRAATAAAANANSNGNAADGNAGALLPSFKLEPLGGGRIEHHPEQGVCHVYGYSAAFGPAPHEVAAALVRRWHPFTTVTTSYDGY